MIESIPATYSTVVVLFLLVGPATAEAQQPRIESLQPTETFPEPFSSLGGLRWLGNGNMLVSDRIEKSVYRINFETGEYDVLGRNGQGPGEYDMPTTILPFSDRMSAVVDMGNTRVALMGPDGSIEQTFPLMQDMTFRMPDTADELGNVYFSSRRSFSIGRGSGPQHATTPSEARITRWNPSTDETEDVAAIAIPPRDIGGGDITISGGRVMGMPAPRPFRPQDVWAVSRDGRIAVARAEPYHVEWIEPRGSTASGTVVAYDPVRIRHSDKEAWADEQSQQSGSFMMSSSGSGGGGTSTFRMPRPDIAEVEFPDVFPAFKPRGATVSFEGDLWLERYESYSSDRVLFDVFNREGNLVKRAALPKGRTLLGFAPGTLFAYYKDQDDLQWLERYQLRWTMDVGR